MLADISENSSFLIQWVNTENAEKVQFSHFYDFEQVANSSFCYLKLLKIDEKFFQSLNHLKFEFFSYFKLIQQYFREVEGKKMKKCFKKIVMEEQSLASLLILIIYLLLKSDSKRECVEKICALRLQAQNYLMKMLSQTQSYFENTIEIKEILQTVEGLEDENDGLKERLRQVLQMNLKLTEIAREARMEKQKLSLETCKYKDEKKTLFDALKIDSLVEYVEIYKHLKHQQDDANLGLSLIEEKIQIIEEKGKQMKEKILEDRKIIAELNQATGKKRSEYLLAKDQLSISLVCSQQQKNVLRENKNFLNAKTRQSLESSYTWNESSRVHCSFQLQRDENYAFHQHNHDLMGKLEVVYKQISDLQGQVSLLKKQNINLKKIYKKGSQKIEKLFEIHSIFEKEYEFQKFN